MSAALISVDTLARQLGDPGLVLIDCRFDLADPQAGLAEFLAGHLPGAFYADLNRELSGPQTGRNGRHPLPARDTLVAFLRARGVSRQTRVVAYDARDGMFAARLWWLLRWLGHDQVAVLDGGLAAWLGAGLALSQETPLAPAEGDLVARDPLSGTVPISVVNSHRAHGLILLDARAAARFRGEIEPIDPVAGHIPGALNRPYSDNLDAHGHFLAPERLREAFLPLLHGHDPEKVVHHCGSGVSACHNLLAMEIAGLPGGRLYPGSWSEWCADPSRPVETGAAHAAP